MPGMPTLGQLQLVVLFAVEAGLLPFAVQRYER
jgi:hypothetical protein